MSTKNWIEFPRIEGETVSAGSCRSARRKPYEREIGRDGFLRPPRAHLSPASATGWDIVRRPLRPRAFAAKAAADSPTSLLTPSRCCPMTPANSPSGGLRCHAASARNADGDLLLSSMRARRSVLRLRAYELPRKANYILLPREPMWRLEPPVDHRAADQGHQRQLQIAGARSARPHALFDPAALDTPKLDENFARSGRRLAGAVRRAGAMSVIGYPFNPLDAVAGRAPFGRQAQLARHPAVMSHRYHIPPSVQSTFVRTASWSAPSCRGRSRAIRRAEGAVLSFERRLRPK